MAVSCGDDSLTPSVAVCHTEGEIGADCTRAPAANARD